MKHATRRNRDCGSHAANILLETKMFRGKTYVIYLASFLELLAQALQKFSLTFTT